ncbi:MAG: hypothetical protein E2P03_03355 [Acidobacteria bacterium]|nr:MAG: hypothetical protein E2P03_03355 [Acidobacteriota bacterium]
MDYPRFHVLDGQHPFRDAVPGGYVAYRARRRPGTRVVWFNFRLAAEMGLIPPGHPLELTTELRRAIRETFALTILNEFDLIHGTSVPAREMLPGTYMATRYLQMQHPSRRGTTSGDGRSIWNGTLRYRGRSWDISSCGTGVTRLCPATAAEGRYFQTGSNDASYGCGTAALDEGMDTALMSEVFHRNGLATERVLTILQDADGFAIVVRAAPSLFRPSHFMVHLKQGAHQSLRAVADLFMARQQENGNVPLLRSRPARYRRLATDMARTFGRLAAHLESEYIFCWLAWDGDNILTDGGIIDYGSVRQFGLCHREYRFDDGPCFSTTLTEQRRKARHLVQNFAQIRDFLITGRKQPLHSYRHDPLLRLFDREFARMRLRRLLFRVGFPEATAHALLARRKKQVTAFLTAHAYFERARSARGPHPVSDGINWNAVFSTRDLLRELPRLLREGVTPSPRDILELAWSSYATVEDRIPSPYRLRMARRLTGCYLQLLASAATLSGRTRGQVLATVEKRSRLINRYARITGDSITHAATALLEARPKLSVTAWHRIIEQFISDQVLVPGHRQAASETALRPAAGAGGLLDQLNDLNEMFRHGL